MTKESSTRTVGGRKNGLEYGLWQCEPCPAGLVVKAFADGMEAWKVVARIAASKGALAEVSRLVELLSAKPHDGDMVRSASKALKAIEREGFTFATEMELDHVITHLERCNVQ
jgi:hypothetical protein